MSIPKPSAAAFWSLQFGFPHPVASLLPEAFIAYRKLNYRNTLKGGGRLCVEMGGVYAWKSLNSAYSLRGAFMRGNLTVFPQHKKPRINGYKRGRLCVTFFTKINNLLLKFERLLLWLNANSVISFFNSQRRTPKLPTRRCRSKVQVRIDMAS